MQYKHVNSTGSTANNIDSAGPTATCVADAMPPSQASHLFRRRQEALEKLDNEAFGWFHVRAIVVSGIGFFTDAYDLFIVNMVVPMLGFVYFADSGNKVPSDSDSVIKGSAAVGTLVGQLVFGYLADRLGRKKVRFRMNDLPMYGVELMIMIFATIASSMAASTVRGADIVFMLSFWRFFLGVGIGGDYPLSAVITSELATKHRRGMMIAAVFAMQGIGILVAALITLIILSMFKIAIEADPKNVDYVWRLCVAFGCIPAAAALYYRLTIPETPRFTFNVLEDYSQAAKDAEIVLKMNRLETSSSSSQSTADGETISTGFHYGAILKESTVAMDSGRAYPEEDSPIMPPMKVAAPSMKSYRTAFIEYFSQWKNLKVLLGCSMCWFTLDVAFYGSVLTAIGFTSQGSAYDTLYSLALGNLIISLMGTVPGYWISVGLIEVLGRRFIQYMGFGVLTVCFLILSLAYHELVGHFTALFIMVFTVAQFFFNFGPNVTTFVFPGEVFPTRFRSTAHGISAASGKAGAILATYAFGPLKDLGGTNAFMPQILGLFAVFMFAGFLCTSLLPETKGKSLEELCGEDEPDIGSD